MCFMTKKRLNHTMKYTPYFTLYEKIIFPLISLSLVFPGNSSWVFFSFFFLTQVCVAQLISKLGLCDCSASEGPCGGVLQADLDSGDPDDGRRDLNKQAKQLTSLRN